MFHIKKEMILLRICLIALAKVVRKILLKIVLKVVGTEKFDRKNYVLSSRI